MNIRKKKLVRILLAKQGLPPISGCKALEGQVGAMLAQALLASWRFAMSTWPVNRTARQQDLNLPSDRNRTFHAVGSSLQVDDLTGRPS